MTELKRRGLMFILSSPSGAGKSTLARTLLKDESDRMKLSISVTTRERRMSEVDEKDYFFISPDQFNDRVERGALLEHATVHGNSYGTPRDFVEETLEKGYDVLFDIDYQGALQLYEKMPDDIVGIFILPPSMQELQSRLLRRAEDSGSTIDKRLENSRDEMLAWERYDYVLVNEDLQETYEKVKAILTAARHARQRYVNMDEFVDGLREEKLN